jgi:hypothetical protein
VVASGAVTFAGRTTYHGLVYAANRGNSAAADVVRITDDATVDGAVFVDGLGGLTIGGSARVHLQLNDRVFGDSRPQGYGPAGLVDNSYVDVPG